MRHLILLRHAKTEKDSANGEDRDRALDPRGREDAPLVGRWLAAQALQPSLALVSSALRTRQTWELLSPLLPDCQAQFVDGLYLASAAQIFQAIRNANAATKTLMVIGHNPGLHELAWALTAKASKTDRAALGINLPTSGAILLDFDIGQWQNLEGQSGTLTAFVTPKSLGESGGR